ncbi:uncharacterized protein LOC135397964 [Ornithodoros turicata]|uniref:uncharacterized protein LOC135397964 n=1 Tax=Ornithodoros turicata TaxID=34597 RepID=UPI003138F43A
MFNFLPALPALPSISSLFSALPFPLAFPLAVVAPLPWALPLLIGLKSAGLLGLGVATGGITGFGLASIGALGVKASLANAALLKLAGVGVAVKAKEAVSSKIAQVKSKLAAPPAIVPVTATKHVEPAVLPPTGWEHALRYGHPELGYGFTRTMVQLRRRRHIGAEAPLREIFAYVNSYDKDRCVQRVLCEVAAEPHLIGDRGKTVADFMLSLEQEADAPWMPYREATLLGRTLDTRDVCYETYKTCDKSTESLVEIAKMRLASIAKTTA